MAGLLAWAADVVGGGRSELELEESIPILFSEEQNNYVRQLDLKSISLQRSINDLRLRLPPPHISQRLPHLHAHSLASNNALTLQLNSHSSTRHQVSLSLFNYAFALSFQFQFLSSASLQAQLREETLKEENAAFQNAISSCDNKIKEKSHEAQLLRTKLEVTLTIIIFIFCFVVLFTILHKILTTNFIIEKFIKVVYQIFNITSI